MRGFYWVLAFLLLPCAWAAPLSGAALDKRANALERQLRCMVCQSQSLADSDASLAQDLRALVRQRLAAGDSDAAIKAFLVARYGDEVLMTPPFKTETFVLWLGPGIVLLFGAGAAAMYIQKRGGA